MSGSVGFWPTGHGDGVAPLILGVHYHVGVVTRDLDEAMAAVGALFGLRWADVVDGTNSPAMSGPAGSVEWGLRRVVHSLGGPMRVELLEGGPGSVWHTTGRAALHHLAYWVDDIAATVARLADDGWSLEVTIASPRGEPSMFAYVTKPGHARLELTDSSRRDETLARLGWGAWRDPLR